MKQSLEFTHTEKNYWDYIQSVDLKRVVTLLQSIEQEKRSRYIECAKECSITKGQNSLICKLAFILYCCHEYPYSHHAISNIVEKGWEDVLKPINIDGLDDIFLEKVI